MSAAQEPREGEIHPFSSTIAEMLADWIEGCLNDHIDYPEDGLDEDDYMAQRKYALDEIDFEETDVEVFEKDDSKLNGLPERLAGTLTLNESKSGQPIGSVTVKMEFAYHLDDAVTRPEK
ncbi:hypothetical protein [Desulfosarcina ovata]|uniref:Uncharacterized protein n=1 Tax=Desulfosarcina ovata subsp. ovata TaxID=2752305 RepID=A0A5K8A3U4_9BACT|nr:hypothetical protein [Desulfosarcina ovata]BBO87215.1 hypothetical protein DSCOOX_03950 [Desulfosarcina ovata subsp. ovata]